MSVATSIVRMFRTKPQSPVTPDGRMALADHFRELRGRILRSVVAILACMVVSLFFFDFLLELVHVALRPGA